MSSKVLWAAGILSVLLIGTLVTAGFLATPDSSLPAPGDSVPVELVEQRLERLERDVIDRLADLETRLDQVARGENVRRARPPVASTEEGDLEAGDGESDPEEELDPQLVQVRLDNLDQRLKVLEDDPVERAYHYLESLDPRLRREGIFSLEDRAKIDPEARAALREMLADPDAGVRQATLDTLADLRDTEALPRVPALLADESAAVREEAIKTIARLKGADYAADLLPLAADGEARVRIAALDALGDLGFQGGASALVMALEDGNEEVRARAITSLGEVGARDAAPKLRQILEESPGKNRTRLILSLNRLGDPGPYRQELSRLGQQALEAESASARRDALGQLRYFERGDVKEIVERARKDSNRDVRRMAEWLARGGRR